MQMRCQCFHEVECKHRCLFVMVQTWPTEKNVKSFHLSKPQLHTATVSWNIKTSVNKTPKSYFSGSLGILVLVL